MKRTAVVTTIIGVALAGTVLALANRVFLKPHLADGSQSHAPVDTAKKVAAPVLLELFTSEGCSSCPPADALLARLVKNRGVAGGDIIPLEEHVDYWNHLGWADPYSSGKFSERQKSYALLMRLGQVYTPQMVVDGRKELLGSDESSARATISASIGTPKSTASIGIRAADSNEVTLDVHINPVASTANNEPADVIAAITEDNLVSNVTHGENAGRRLQHVGVVRRWQVIGHMDKTVAFAGSIRILLDSGWKLPDLNAVVFAQGHDSGQVYGASTIKIETAKTD